MAVRLLMLAILAALPVAAQVRWTHLTSARGDLPISDPGPEPTASLVLHVDKDGVDDFITAGRHQGPGVVWCRRSKGGWTRYVIDSAFLRIEAGGAFHDIDGDLDIISIGWSHPRVLLDENKARK